MVDRSVDAVNLAGSSGVIDMSMMGLIAQADMVVKLVMLLLLISSIWCWGIIFDKWSRFRKSRYKMFKFEKAYRSCRSLNALYDRVRKDRPDSAMSAMFLSSMNETQNLISLRKKDELEFDGDFTSLLRERVYGAAQRTKNMALEFKEKNLIILATVGSASPFIGLFGTVWGIVNSFQAIAATKNTTLAVVAPGIAEALLATAIGLFAAIPAVIFYNLFSNEIRKTDSKLEDFAQELSATLANNKW